MMPICDHKHCKKPAEKCLDVYLQRVGERKSAFPDFCVYLCEKHYRKLVSKRVGGGE